MRRGRRAGQLLFLGGLLGMYFVFRAVPADWEIGPFLVDAGSASKHQPVAPLALGPVTRSSSQAPSATPLVRSTPGPTASVEPTETPESRPSASATSEPEATPRPTATPTPRPTPTPHPTPTPTPTPTSTPTPTATPTPISPALAITNATDSVHCGESLKVTATGTFQTNGSGGTVTYYWLRSDASGTKAQPNQTMTVAIGDTSAHVVATDHWTPTGNGSEQLVFVTPTYPLAAKNFFCGG